MWSALSHRHTPNKPNKEEIRPLWFLIERELIIELIRPWYAFTYALLVHAHDNAELAAMGPVV